MVILLVKALRKYLKEKSRSKNKSFQGDLGDILKEIRLSKKLSQEFVAEALGVSRQAVSKWENGVTDPSTRNLIH